MADEETEEHKLAWSGGFGEAGPEGGGIMPSALKGTKRSTLRDARDESFYRLPTPGRRPDLWGARPPLGTVAAKKPVADASGSPEWSGRDARASTSAPRRATRVELLTAVEAARWRAAGLGGR